LDSAKLGTLNQVINQLPIRLMMVINQRVPILNFVWTNSVRIYDCCCCFHCILEWGKIHKFLKFSIISHVVEFYAKKYIDMQVLYFFLDKIMKLHKSHVFSH